MKFPETTSYKRNDPPPWRRTSTVDYIRQYSLMNGLKQCKFTIGDVTVLA